jgi:hypothetical protein
MNKLTTYIVASVLALSVAMMASAPVMAVNSNPPQATTASCDKRFLTLPTWHRGVVDASADCKVKNVVETVNDPSSEITMTGLVWTIVANIIEMILHLVGYIAVAFIIMGGFRFMTAGGAPENIAKARSTITNAVIGLIISIVSIAVVNFIMAAIIG